MKIFDGVVVAEGKDEDDGEDDEGMMRRKVTRATGCTV